MEDGFEKFDKNKVWNLVPKLENFSIIRTKWVFKNKMDELGKESKIKLV